MWWLVALVTVVVLFAMYVTWVANRVDRCHARAAAAFATLDAHLVRRAAVALEVADAAGDGQLRWAARVALDATAEDREAAENDLTRVLRDRLRGRPEGEPPPGEVVDSSRRVALGRQVHNDLVRDALALRRRRLVRLLRLARGHHRPAYFDIDDPLVDG